MTFRSPRKLIDILKENERMGTPDWLTSDPDDRDLPLADRKDAKPYVEQLWVCWIPTGKGPMKDEGACVGNEWVCRKKASQWLKADDMVGRVFLAPIHADEVVHATLEPTEVNVDFSDAQEF